MKLIHNRFSNRENQVFEVAELEQGKWYLANRRFNAKRIISQPCRLAETPVQTNTYGSKQLVVQWADGQTGTVFITEVDGVDVCASSAGQPSVEPLTEKWLARERAKLQKLVDQAQTNLDQLDTVVL